MNQNSDDDFEFQKNSSDDEFEAIGLGKPSENKTPALSDSVDQNQQQKLKAKFDQYNKPNFSNLGGKPKISAHGGAGFIQNRLAQKSVDVSKQKNEKLSLNSQNTAQNKVEQLSVES